MRKQGYDGAADTSGVQNDLQARVCAENIKALQIYCFGHNMSLVVQYSTRKWKTRAACDNQASTALNFETRIDVRRLEGVRYLERPLWEAPRKWKAR